MERVILLVGVLTVVAGCGVDTASQLEGSLNELPFDAGAGCPATWLEARMICSANVACDPAENIRCGYPGAGDCFTDGGCATAAMGCFDSLQTGGPRFTCAQ